MLQGPAPRLARRGAAGAIGAEGHQPHLAHVGAGGAVLDTEATGLLKAVGRGGAARSAAARAVDLVAGHPSCLWRGALGRGGLRWVLAASPRLWAHIAVQTLGRPAAVGAPSAALRCSEICMDELRVGRVSAGLRSWGMNMDELRLSAPTPPRRPPPSSAPLGAKA